MGRCDRIFSVSRSKVTRSLRAVVARIASKHAYEIGEIGDSVAPASTWGAPRV